jgi:hypothetical protein
MCFLVALIARCIPSGLLSVRIRLHVFLPDCIDMVPYTLGAFCQLSGHSDTLHLNIQQFVQALWMTPSQPPQTLAT